MIRVFGWDSAKWSTMAVTGLLLGSVAVSHAATLTVPGQYPNIQAALYRAEGGDVVEIADGVYTGAGNAAITIYNSYSSQLTIRSASGDPNRCIIDCEGASRAFTIYDKVVIEGFTIRNGYSEYAGGGVYCTDHATATFNDCVFENCHVLSGNGGAIYFQDSANGWFTRCVFYQNRVESSAGRGGAVYLERTNWLEFDDCVFIENYAQDYGGCIYSYLSKIVAERCSFQRNVGDRGGAIYCDDVGYYEYSALNLRTCHFSRNEAARGGAIYIDDADLEANATRFENNLADYGGAISTYSSEGGSIYNCLFLSNHANQEGGAIYRLDGTQRNCTYIGNTAGIRGGAVLQGDVIYNCIAWNNAPDQFKNADNVSYCLVQGGWSGAGEGNIDTDPQFALAGDYHLAPDSPCIDAGSNDEPFSNPRFYWNESVGDMDALPRVVDGDADDDALTDIGAYEYDPNATILAVDQLAFEFSGIELGPNPDAQTLKLQGVGPGVMNWIIYGVPEWLDVSPIWCDNAGEVDVVMLSIDINGLIPHHKYEVDLLVASPEASNPPHKVHVKFELADVIRVPRNYSTIQAAIDASVSGDEIQLVDGVYAGDGNKNLDFAGKAVKLYSTSNDPNLCIIDCEGDGRGFYFHSNEGPATQVRGLTIRNGYVDPNSPGDGHGGGMLVTDGCCPTIEHCTFFNNQADSPNSYGAGLAWLHMLDSGCVATLNDCRFVNNTIVNATSYPNGGAGVALLNTSIEMNDCQFIGNQARGTHGFAGGLLFEYGDLTLNRCEFRSNSAYASAGAVHASDAQIEIHKTHIAGNIAKYRAGMDLSNCVTLLESCSIVSNRTLRYISAIGASEGELYLQNCLIASNYDSYGSVLLQLYRTDVFIDNSTIAGNWSSDTAVAFDCASCSAVLNNSIVWNDLTYQFPSTNYHGITINHSLIRGGYSGTAIIDADPLFVDPDGPDDDPNTWEDNDFRLLPGSPCIDAGDNSAVPADVYDLDKDGDPNEPWPVGFDGLRRFFDDTNTPDTGLGTAPIVDIGAYEYGAQIKPGCVGDLNCDGGVDAFDIDPFIIALLQPAQYAAQYPDCQQIHADANANGSINAFDIDPFIETLLAGGSGGCW